MPTSEACPWFETDQPLPDGWYWWRPAAVMDSGEPWPNDDLEVLQVRAGKILDIGPIHLHGTTYWRHVEHAKFHVGQWNGPIPFPTGGAQ